MSLCRKYKVRDKVIGKKGIYLERYPSYRRTYRRSRSESGSSLEKNTLHRVWAVSEGKKGPQCADG